MFNNLDDFKLIIFWPVLFLGSHTAILNSMASSFIRLPQCHVNYILSMHSLVTIFFMKFQNTKLGWGNEGIGENGTVKESEMPLLFDLFFNCIFRTQHS